MENNKKLMVGVDINEVLRAQWLKFDMLYVEEFGEEGAPSAEEAYTFDFYKSYKWKAVSETINVLKEPEETPDDINPVDYQPDASGFVPADALLTRKETTKLTAREVYKRFMFVDFVFELYARAPQMYRGIDLHVQQFVKKYSETVDFSIVSVENWFTIPSTLSFLSTMLSRFKNIKFVDESLEKWDGIDILITADPEVLNNVPDGKIAIIMKRPFNTSCNGTIEALQVADLLNNKEFQTLIGYVETEQPFAVPTEVHKLTEWEKLGIMESHEEDNKE